MALNDLRAEPERERLLAMGAALVHRGPDDEGLVVRGPLGGVFRRLSIIDLAGGAQPLFNETGDVAVLGNGEIYNHRELREGLRERGHDLRSGSDMEVVVHLYEERGADLVRELVGMFALCVLDWRDPRQPRVLLARDRIGIKPLFFVQDERGLAWGSEPKALLAGGCVGRELRATSLLDYLVQGYCAGSESAWRGMERLEAAHVLEWSPGERARQRPYWDLPRDALREPAAPEEIREWVDRVVAEHRLADVPLGAFLSGGIDSTAVVTSMAAGDESVVACSVGFRERSHDELGVAVETARRLGVIHHTDVLEADPAAAVEALPWFYDEPLADPSTVPTWLVSRMAREHVTVALSGDGGDEVFAGYRRYVFDVAEQRVRRAVGPRAARMLGAVGRHYPRLAWAPRFLRAGSVLANLGEGSARAYWNSVTQLGRAEALEVLAAPLRAELAGHDPFDAFEDHYRRPAIDDPLYRAQYADFHGFLPEQILTKTDRASMAVSLEVRVPLLDHRFVERFVHLPRREKVRGGRGKHALREALRGRLPARVLDGPKRGFDTPLGRWIRGGLAEAVADALETLPETWVDRETLRRRYAEHQAGRRDHAHLLWSLLVLEHWRRRHDVRGVAA
jgi:asparagine synthase (glutamine-hydrolysing)